MLISYAFAAPHTNDIERTSRPSRLSRSRWRILSGARTRERRYGVADACNEITRVAPHTRTCLVGLCRGPCRLRVCPAGRRSQRVLAGRPIAPLHWNRWPSVSGHATQVRSLRHPLRLQEQCLRWQGLRWWPGVPRAPLGHGWRNDPLPMRGHVQSVCGRMDLWLRASESRGRVFVWTRASTPRIRSEPKRVRDSR